MAASRQIKNSFTAGELAPELLGRSDLRAYANGARELRNVLIQPTGGVTRRPGLRHVAGLPGPTRLVAFEFNTEQTYLLALSHRRLQVFAGDALLAEGPGPWTAAHLPGLSWTQTADTLLLVHPDLPPQVITRTGAASWVVRDWNLDPEPFHRFAPAAAVMTPSGGTGTVTLETSEPVFLPGHVGARFRVVDGLVRIAAVLSPQRASAAVEGSISEPAPTRDWTEAAFSGARGWPVSVCFHQDRLVIGGSRDLPNRLWLSRTGDLFSFELGKGLDDEAIAFGLYSDQVNAIRAVFSGRSLQVFTSGSEWMVSGEPLTPASIQLDRQTRIGSRTGRNVPPVDVDGSTIFAARSGRALYEFAYTEVAQAYQANDLALVAHHLVRDPVDLCYDQLGRLLHVAMADGRLATLTLYRAEAVTAWTRIETDGAFRALAEVEGTVWAAVERMGGWRLERFDAGLSLDAALAGESGDPQDRWRGLEHLEGRRVAVLADGAPREDETVVLGAVTVDPPALSVQAGLPYRHVIEPLPPELAGAAGAGRAPLRLVSATFRVLATAALDVDLGRGPVPVPFRRLDTPLLDAAPPHFTGEASMRGLGWKRDAMAPLWRVEGSLPLPMTLLSVTTETRTTD